MIVHEFSDEEDNDILLPYDQFNDHHDQLISELLRNFQQNKDVLRRGQNQEDIIMRECGESDPELEAQQDDLPRGLDAMEQIHRGFKHMQLLEKGNQKCWFQDPFYNLQYDIEEEEDILRRLELDSEFKTEPEQYDNEEDEDILRRLELDNEMGKTEQNDNMKEEEEIRIRLGESFIESALRRFKKQPEPHICSTCLQRLPDRESDIKIKQRMDESIEKEASQPDNIKEDEHPLILFMKSVPEAMNAAENNEQKDLRVILNYELKRKTTLKMLLDLEEIGWEFYIFIEHIIPMLNLNDKEKVRSSKLEDKLKYVEKVKDLLQTSSKTVNKVINELERTKKKDEGKTENIPEILAQFMEFNAYLVERSFLHGIEFVFDTNSTKTQLCVQELNRWREKLEIILRGLGRMIKREMDRYKR
uniref:Uncharacterized protein n=1 Tax=Cucumis melo TaxID=3656 RepID=A0A9I9CQS2_CUCME